MKRKQSQFPHYPDLKNKRVLITGGGSGIGAGLVQAFSEQLAKITFVDIATDPAEELCSEIERKMGIRPRFIPCDIRNVEELQKHIEEITSEEGGFDVLVNNAARDDRHDLSGLSVEDWNDMLNTNLRPCFFTIQSVSKLMKENLSGSIINFGSNAANLGLTGFPAYITSKAGIVGLTKALSRELGPFNIRVNAIVPGWVITERQKQFLAMKESLNSCLDQQSLKRTVKVEDVANSALFLASSASAMITGQSIIVDGGRV